ncbi:IucA/IucC family protein [Bacillus spongiae]|uniref:IucA/IucC family protein n=1 Tax=Bacillus spongiae TaxID=2683610 RepID=A0ABU8H9P3_9BACI
MQHTAKQIALYASFQAFLNGYIREISGGRWMKKDEWVKEQRTSEIMTEPYVYELELPLQSIRLAIGVKYRSLVGRHTFGITLTYSEGNRVWEKSDELITIMTLNQELYLRSQINLSGQHDPRYDELTIRIMDSYQTMTRIIEQRMEDATSLYDSNSSFIETEQSLIYGHWLHPTPKSRQGMAQWQQSTFSPELKGSFQLHYFLVNRSIVRESSVLHESASQICKQPLIQSECEINTLENECVIPIHPLQAQWLLQQPSVKEVMEAGLIQELGILGPYYQATSSLRTVYNEDDPYMYKFSIPVKVTNSLRVNRRHELKAGGLMASLMNKLHYTIHYPSFQIIHDPAFITVDFPDQLESGFEVIIRSNVFQRGQGEGISSIAALVQDPIPGHKSRLYNIIVDLVQLESESLESESLESVSFKWFKEYWHCTIEPLIKLYDQYGIALEAHQQNSVLDVSAGYPKTYYYRDNQGYYLSKSYQESLLNLEPMLVESPELFYEDECIQDRFAYYLIWNQLFSIIHRLGADHLIREEELLKWSTEQLRDLLTQLGKSGKTFVQSILNNEKLAYKGNLLTSFYNVDELTAELEQAVYCNVPNPFFLHGKEGEYAFSKSSILS